MTRYKIRKETTTGIDTIQAPPFFSGLLAQKEVDRLNEKHPGVRHYHVAIDEMDYEITGDCYEHLRDLPTAKDHQHTYNTRG